MNEDYKCPCKEVDPNNFLTNEEVFNLLKTKNSYKFKQKDYLRLYNCIHCNDCGTSEERFLLKQKFLDDGNKIDGFEDTINALTQFGTPFVRNQSRIKLPEGIPEESDTLLYFGCFTAVKTPKYGENVAKYLLKSKLDFCVLDKENCCGYPILCTGHFSTYFQLVEHNLKLFKERGFKKIITVCPSCYMVFKKHYTEQNIIVKYFTEYLNPSNDRKEGNLIIQHACPLKNGEIPSIVEEMENLYKKSGYNVLEKIPTNCCGFGVGHQLRIDISEAIAKKRMEDFKENSYLIDMHPDKENYITSYCPDAYWVLKAYGRKYKIEFKAKDLCELLL